MDWPTLLEDCRLHGRSCWLQDIQLEHERRYQAYHGEPYATRYLLAEAFEDDGVARVQPIVPPVLCPSW
jgi:hypothetical protein